MSPRVEYPVIRSLVIDPLPSALFIEAVLGDYLKPPPEGIYTLGHTVPVMLRGRAYSQERVSTQGRQRVAVTGIADIAPGFPVIDKDGEVAVTARQIPFLSDESSLPVRAIEIVERTLRDTLEHYGDPKTRHHNTDPGALYRDLLLPQWQHEFEIIDQILLFVSELRNQVKAFAGPDKWIIHFLRRERTTLIIEQSIDWRIVQYYRLRDELRGRLKEHSDA